MRPAPGNHEWERPPALGYFDYFGARAGPRGRGWYSYDAGGWHFVALNGNCEAVGCAPGSAQERWLRADLARHRRPCTLAYWHQPRFSSGLHGNAPNTAPLWADLQAAGAELVLSGHDHSYERFAPQNASGGFAPARGIIQFVAGTGGVNHYPIVHVKRNSRAHNSTTFGVLELRLRARSPHLHRHRLGSLPLSSISRP
jgi:alkaline phosphatase